MIKNDKISRIDMIKCSFYFDNIPVVLNTSPKNTTDETKTNTMSEDSIDPQSSTSVSILK